MKKAFLLIPLLFSLAGCWKDYTNKQSFTLITTFDYTESDEEIFGDRGYYNASNFVYNVLLFYNNQDDSGFTGGCALGNTASTKLDTTVFNPYSVHDAVYGETGNRFMVYKQNPDKTKMPEDAITFLYKDNNACTCTPSAMFVNNTTETVAYIKGYLEGEGFQKGDYLKLKTTGYLGGTATASKDFNLAVFNETMDSVVTAWSKVDLAELGTIDAIRFELSSSREDMPLTFCMDEMVAAVELQY